MDNKNYKQVSNYFALTVKKENKLTLKKVSKSIARITTKITLYLAFLLIANIFV